MAKLRGLGRGLDALLSGNEPSTTADTLDSLPIGSLRAGRYQPRTHMDEQSLAELAESIKAQGVMQPILVRPDADGNYEIIAGERRWRAAKLAGLNEVPAVTRVVGDDAALAMALIENIQREDLNPLEEAGGIQRLIDEFGMTHQTASEAVGRSRSAVTNLLRLLGLAAPVRALLSEGKLDMGHARALLQLDGAKQIEMANAIVSRRLSVREAERMANRSREPASQAPRPRDRDIVRLEEEVSQRLGANVTIRPRKKGGAIVIDYSDLDQLDAILGKL